MENRWGKPGEPVPPVDIEDLEKAWQLVGELQRRSVESGKMIPADQFGIDWACFKPAFKPGTNLAALSFRWMLLGLSCIGKNPEKMREGWFNMDVPSETVLRNAATLPIVWPSDTGWSSIQ